MKAYITGLACYLPDIVEENTNARLRKKTGIERRRICPPEMTASDLACKAAEKLFSEGIDRNIIDYVILCTQSPDYFLPTTACIIQQRLNLAKNCGAFDYNLGCSGYIYGLGIAKGLIESGQAGNILLLTSETYSKYINPRDNATKPLFGDGASATLVSAFECECDGIYGNVYGTDGGGAESLIVPSGGMRNPFRDNDIQEYTDAFGNFRTNRDLYMNGAEIMNFALDVVPDTLEKILSQSSLSRNDIDYYVFHQANKMMLDYLREKCALQDMPYWNDVTNYGNTVSSSIPLALSDMMSLEGNLRMKRVMIIGFGVGLSWGGCVIDLSRCNIH